MDEYNWLHAVADQEIEHEQVPDALVEVTGEPNGKVQKETSSN